jgi:catechol 2,3-dioxygenase-like lactoylglutathione lyase family enzyme
LRGRHLRLPGHGERGPTIEIFTYNNAADQPLRTADQLGYGHLAFEVADVASALQRVIDHGGEPLGQVSTTTVPGVGELEVTYARDPEGNIIELQAWP